MFPPNTPTAFFGVVFTFWYLERTSVNNLDRYVGPDTSCLRKWCSDPNH